MIQGVQRLRVAESEAGMRLDRWLKRQCSGLTQGRIESWARRGELRLDGQRVRAGTRLLAGQEVRLPPGPDTPCSASPAPACISKRDTQFIRSMLLYEDEHIIALNKPPGLAVQGGSKTSRHIDGMAAALVPPDAPRPRLVHRLDRYTSGVLVLARSADSAARLAAQFRDRRIQKLYWALTEVPPSKDKGRIETGLVKRRIAPAEREQMRCVSLKSPGAVHAITEYQTLARHQNGASWVALWPHTGRTHQLRAHMAYLGCPIRGDSKYAPHPSRTDTPLCLHARSLSLPDTPLITAPPPAHLLSHLESLHFDMALGDVCFPYHPEV